jgi:hypothetical protein
MQRRFGSSFVHGILPGNSEPVKDSRKYADIFADAPAVNRMSADLRKRYS